jgi:hypothetical protein
MMHQFEEKIEYLMVMVEQNDNQVHEQLYDMMFQDDQQQHNDSDHYYQVEHAKPFRKINKLKTKIYYYNNLT